MNIEIDGLKYINDDDVFSKQDFYVVLKDHGYSKTMSSFLVSFQVLINDGFVQRVGRNLYQVASKKCREYEHQYSALALNVSKHIKKNHPYLDYVIFETVQLNEFMNHQIGKNTIFVFTENDVMDFVFDSLKNAFPGKVLLSPSIKEFHKYRDENSIVLIRLISESPKGQKEAWHESIEKLLVDVIADSLIKETFSESEYKAIYEDAFDKFIIDESKMLRYAKRRGAADKILNFIKENTSVKLRTEMN